LYELAVFNEKNKFESANFQGGFKITQTSLNAQIFVSMAIYLYKWLALVSIPMLMGHANQPHPFHVSTTEITHNTTDKDLEISCRIFTDDFETAITNELKQKADFSGEAAKAAMDPLVKKYLLNHLAVSANGKAAALTYVGWEKENEAVYVYFEADGIAAVSDVKVTDTILFNLFDDQISIIHVKVNGNRKSTKLTYPEKVAAFSF